MSVHLARVGSHRDKLLKELGHMNAKAQFYLVRLDSLIAETEVNVLCQVGTDPIEVTRLAVSRWLHCIEVVV